MFTINERFYVEAFCSKERVYPKMVTTMSNNKDSFCRQSYLQRKRKNLVFAMPTKNHLRHKNLEGDTSLEQVPPLVVCHRYTSLYLNMITLIFQFGLDVLLFPIGSHRRRERSESRTFLVRLFPCLEGFSVSTIFIQIFTCI